MKNIEIIPAILPQSFEDLEEKLNILKEAYVLLDLDEKMMVQIDVFRNIFFDDIYSKESLTGKVNKMEDVKNYFDIEYDLLRKCFFPTQKFNLIGVKRVIIHFDNIDKDLYESNKDTKLKRIDKQDFNKFVEVNSKKGIEVGLGIRMNNSLEEIKPFLEKIDFVQFMGIDRVGFQGSSFNSRVIEKIKEFRKQNPEMIVSVDGGVNLENAKDLIDAGVNRLVSGSAIFGKNNTAQEVVENIKRFKDL